MDENTGRNMSQKSFKTFMKPLLKVALFSVFTVSAVFISGCSDDDNNNDGPNEVVGIVVDDLPKAGDEIAAFSINASGGNGGTGAGGSGGDANTVTITLNSAKAGRLEIKDNGLADADFTLATYTADPGSNPLTISDAMTISLATTKPAVGTAYMVEDDINLYVATDSALFADPLEIVTGLSVAAGGVLTLALNSSTQTMAELVFSDDVSNAGAIETLDSAGDTRGHLNFIMHNYFASGTISTSGTSAAAFNAGDIQLVTDNDIVNSGKIEATGFAEAGMAGGTGGDIKLISLAALENTAMIDSSGGDAESGGFAAGDAGLIDLNANYGHLYNSGLILSKGGNGDGNGAKGGRVRLYVPSSRIGSIKNSGQINSSGGVGAAGDGGNAGSISIESVGGDLINSASIMADGGNAADDFTGGDGANIKLNTQWGTFDSHPGNLIVSGNLSTKGGNASGGSDGVGGDAGSIEIEGNEEMFQSKQLLGLWGYSSISAKGGSGASPASGKTVSVNVNASGATYVENWEHSSVGDLVNEVDIDTSGSSTTSPDASASFAGGAGGAVQLIIGTNLIGDTSTLVNSGAIITRSGDNQNSGSQVGSGNVKLNAPGGVTNSASIDTQGGIDTSIANAGLSSSTTLVSRVGNSNGNHGGYIFITSNAGDVVNNGVLTASGGDAEVLGGNAGHVDISGLKATNTSDITTAGGNSTVLPLFASAGGNSGIVYIRSRLLGGVSNSGTVLNSRGAGQVPGLGNRQYMIDGD